MVFDPADCGEDRRCSAGSGGEGGPAAGHAGPASRCAFAGGDGGAAVAQLPGGFAELREPEVAEFIQLPLLLLVGAVLVVSEEVVEVLARQQGIRVEGKRISFADSYMVMARIWLSERSGVKARKRAASRSIGLGADGKEPFLSLIFRRRSC
ncbi:MAG: hypothetical protein V8T86_04535 [Victivallis sp.]